MTINKILGKSHPAVTTLTVLYTVPTAKQASSNLFICNQHASNTDTIRIALVPAGESVTSSHYIAYGMSVGAGQTINFTGISLNSGDQILVYSTIAECSFVATGIEVTPST
jgi:hypothetical protein